MLEDLFVVEEANFSIPIRQVKKMGWRRDHPDFRDRMLALPEEKTKDFPKTVDFRPKEHFPVYDQGDLGSCTANAVASALHLDQVMRGTVDFAPSTLFIYYNERSLEGTADKDSGAQLRDGLKVCSKLGICREASWQQDVEKFKERPPSSCYEEALKHRILEYARVGQSLAELKGCLKEGFPFVFGFAVFASFFSQDTTTTGRVRVPRPSEAILGGHSALALGYDDEEGAFIVRNSWGGEWGDGGYCYLPYGYLSNPGLASDFWAIRCGEGKDFPTRRVA